MKSRVTLTVDDGLLREARKLAAEDGLSLSAFLSAQFEQSVRMRKDYKGAMRRALQRIEQAEVRGFRPPGTRDELHER